MKQLLLIRHAKATQESGFKDFERPLTHQGIQDATAMAARLHTHGYIPELIVASPALRTKTTANIFSEHLSVHAPLTDTTIYEASGDALFDLVNALPNAHDFIAIVGHNPGMAQLLHYLTGQIRDVPTCAVALISFDIAEWQAITMDTGTLVYYDTPKPL